VSNWKDFIDREAKGEKVIFCTVSDEILSKEFCWGHRGKEGVPFTAWTRNHVLFPVINDGTQWVESVPRYPCKESTEPIGG